MKNFGKTEELYDSGKYDCYVRHPDLPQIQPDLFAYEHTRPSN